ncbi:MAG: DUF4832 domain-containing protein [Thermoguttaceae bacterium]|nr:DUF4832 domain-containing protein [Thermoguttaceae bacterium]
MKRRTIVFPLVFVLSAAVMSLFAAERTVVEPVDDGRALINPNMGWTMHFYSNETAHYGCRLEPSDSLDWFEGCSVVYLRVPWAYLEPEEGVYNWALLDTPAQRWIAKGKQVGFRFTTSESWMEYATPKWVFDAGAKSIPFTFPRGYPDGPRVEGNLYDPVFDDPIFLEKLDRFLAAAGARYNGRPEVAFIDIGTFGLWGEGHTLMSSKLSDAENARMARIHIDLHKKHFPDTQLFVIDDVIGHDVPGDDFPLMNEAVSEGIGLRDDSIFCMEPPTAWYHGELAQKFWPTVPTFLEHGHYPVIKGVNWWNDEKLLESVEVYHASYMSIHGWPKEEWKDCREVIRRINRRLGYRLQLRAIDYPQTVKIGEFFDVSTVWANAGVAPCYDGGFFALTIKDADGGIVAVLSDETFDVKSLPVGPADAIPTVEHSSRFRAGLVAPTTKPGKYDLYFSVGRRDGTPVYELPYGQSDGQRRYKIDRIELTQ